MNTVESDFRVEFAAGSRVRMPMSAESNSIPENDP